MNLFDYTIKSTDEYCQWLWNHFPKKCLKSILDIGAGDGRLWENQLCSIPSKATILLMDEDELALEEALTSLDDPRFKIKVANVETEDFGKNKFDLIYAGSLLPYIKKRKKLYLKVFDSLKEGGLFISDLNGKNNLIELRNDTVKNILSPLKPQNPIWQLAKGINLEEVHEELEDHFANCKIIKFKNAVHVPNAKMIVSYHAKFEKKLTATQRKELLEYYDSLRSATKDHITLTLDWGIVVLKK